MCHTALATTCPSRDYHPPRLVCIGQYTIHQIIPVSVNSLVDSFFPPLSLTQTSIETVAATTRYRRAKYSKSPTSTLNKPTPPDQDVVAGGNQESSVYSSLFCCSFTEQYRYHSICTFFPCVHFWRSSRHIGTRRLAPRFPLLRRYFDNNVFAVVGESRLCTKEVLSDTRYALDK